MDHLNEPCCDSPIEWVESESGDDCETFGRLGDCWVGDYYFDSTGVSANDACCACGGGFQVLASCALQAVNQAGPATTFAMTAHWK